MKACLLIQTETAKHHSVAKVTSKLRGVVFAFATMGRIDVVAKVEVASLKDLTDLIMEVGGIQGVLATQTLIAMEA